MNIIITSRGNKTPLCRSQLLRIPGTLFPINPDICPRQDPNGNLFCRLADLDITHKTIQFFHCSQVALLPFAWLQFLGLSFRPFLSSIFWDQMEPASYISMDKSSSLPKENHLKSHLFRGQFPKFWDRKELPEFLVAQKSTESTVISGSPIPRRHPMIQNWWIWPIPFYFFYDLQQGFPLPKRSQNSKTWLSIKLKAQNSLVAHDSPFPNDSVSPFLRFWNQIVCPQTIKHGNLKCSIYRLFSNQILHLQGLSIAMLNCGWLIQPFVFHQMIQLSWSVKSEVSLLPSGDLR